MRNVNEPSNFNKLNKKLSRRKVKGLVVNRQKQLRLAVSCASLILLPSLIFSVTFISDLAIEDVRLSDSGLAPHEIADRLITLAIRYGLISVGIFVGLSTLSIYVSLKMSNSIVGPVSRLEAFVDDLIQKKYDVRTNLRKGDYLKPLSEALDRLAESLLADSRKDQ